MEFTHYTSSCAQAAADLVNTKGSTSGNEYMGTPELVREFLDDHEFMAPETITNKDVAELHEMRTRLHEVFHAPDDKTATELLNRLFEELEVKPFLTDHDGDWHFHYTPDEASVARRVGASAAVALGFVIAEHGFERTGVCAAENCKDVYVDMSRNRSRRYCNEICSSRMNVAAYRKRHKAKTG